MQKNRLAFVIAALIIIALVAVFMMAYHFVHESPAERNPVIIKATHPVIIVDLDNDKALTQKELGEGHDAVLAIRTLDKTTHSTNDQLFSSESALKRLDANKDGRLDKKDPIFNSLELVFLNDGGKTRKVISLTQAGITALIFEKGLAEKIAQFTEKSNHIIGHAIKTNGKKLEIRIIPVDID